MFIIFCFFTCCVLAAGETDFIKTQDRENGTWSFSPPPSLGESLNRQPGVPWRILLYYRWPGGERPGSLFWKTKTGSEEFLFFPNGRENRPLVFYSEQWKTLPEEIILRAEGLEGLRASLEYRSGENPNVPLSVDLGTMMYYPRTAWRNSEYELFTWNLHPRILYLVSGSFAIQSRFLKRLAFFTEKPGFAGTLAEDDKIAGLRDWFAHDYRSRDLARFFELARQEQFPLNPSEVLLRNVLLDQGIIKRSGSRFVEGTGALIGLSLESQSRLPVYYVHETVHGLEFTMPELQKIFGEFFNSLDTPEQNFMRASFAYREYNVESDQVLLASETAAYLLQQKPEETDRYFREYILPWYMAYQRRRLGREEGETYSDTSTALFEAPGFFGRRGAQLQQQFEKLTGLRAEVFFELLPKKPPF